MPLNRPLSAVLAALGVFAAGLLFSTPPALAAPPEEPVTQAATVITGTTATLNGELNPKASATTGFQFAYSPTGSCTEGSTTKLEAEKTGEAIKVSTPVTKLEGSTEYTFCLLATQLEGETLETTSGLPLKLTTLAEKPLVESQSSSVTPFAATIEAQVNPENQPTESCAFEYGETAKYGKLGSCEPATLAGSPTAQVESARLKGLKPGTTDHYRFVVANATGETKGPDGQFTTLTLEKPLVPSEAATAITPFDAKLEAKVNPNYQETGYHFEYSTKATGEVLEAPITIVEGAPPAALLSAVFEEQPAGPVDLGGVLLPATTYFYRVVATNATGSTTGKVEQFTTLTAEMPVVTAESVTALTSTGTTVNAIVNPNYQETTYALEYATNEALVGAITVLGAGPLPAEFAELPVTVGTGVLAPGTTYFYRVAATNKTGIQLGTVEHFTTLATPVVTTGAASNITRTSATLAGTVNPVGAATTYHFAYIEQAGYEAAVSEKAANPYAKGGITPESASVGSDYTVHAVGPLQVSELHPGVTYHYALVATNSVGAMVDPIGATFTTSPPTPPIAVTGEAVSVTQLSATLTGAVNTQGLQTALQFEFGTTPGAGFLVPATVVPGSESGSTVGISDAFSGSLQQGTTYYYRTVATNSDGTSYGAERSFTTGSFPGLPAVTPVQLIAWPPFVAALSERAAREAHEGTNAGPPTRPLTKAQKLAKALKACTKKPNKQRSSCRRQAKRRYR